MNKFKLISLIILCVLTITLTACSKPTDLDGVNTLIDKNYTSLKLEISSTKDDLSLTSTYNIKKETNNYRVTYSEEKYNTLSLDGSNNNNYKSTFNGEVLYDNNGNETVISGYGLNLNIKDLNLKKFKLKEDSLTNITFEDSYVSANINNLYDYLGINGSHGKISINYSNNTIKKITLSYQSNNYTNIITYTVL